MASRQAPPAITPNRISSWLLRAIHEHCGATRELCEDCLRLSKRAAEWQARADGQRMPGVEAQECVECGGRPAAWDSVTGCCLCDRCADDVERILEREGADA